MLMENYACSGSLFLLELLFQGIHQYIQLKGSLISFLSRNWCSGLTCRFSAHNLVHRVSKEYQHVIILFLWTISHITPRLQLKYFTGCHNSSPLGHIVDKKFAFGHRKCQFISVYTSKDLPILHFESHIVGYFSFLSFDFFCLIYNSL